MLSIKEPYYWTEKDYFAFHSDIQRIRKNHVIIFVVDLFYHVKNSNSKSYSVSAPDMTCQSPDTEDQSVI